MLHRLGVRDAQQCVGACLGSGGEEALQTVEGGEGG